MNHIYKVIWNTITQTWVAVSELSRAKGKTKSSKTLSAVVLAAVSAGAIVGGAEAAINYPQGTHTVNGMAIGTNSYANRNSVAYGEAAKANDGYSVAIGANAVTNRVGNGEVGVSPDRGMIAIGSNSVAKLEGATAIGSKAEAAGQQSTAVGNGAQAKGYNSSAFGEGAIAEKNYGVAVGKSANAKEQLGIAVGKNASAENYLSTAVGAKTQAKGESSIAIGSGDLNGGTDLDAPEGAKATGNASMAVGASAKATADNATALGKKATASGRDSIAAGATANASGTDSIATGHNANATGANAVATGANASAAGNAVATGANASAAGNAVATGTNASAAGYAAAYGDNSKATATDASAFGNSANVSAQNGTAIGSHSTVTAMNGTALGNQAEVTSAGGVALGQGSKTTNKDGTVRQGLNKDSYQVVRKSNDQKSEDYKKFQDGGFSYSDEDTPNKVYAPVKLVDAPGALEAIKDTIRGSTGPVSIGNQGTTRQLINVAPGSADSDAVNVAQLKAVAGAIKHYDVVSPNGDITVTHPDPHDPNKTVWNLNLNHDRVKEITAWKLRDVDKNGNPKAGKTDALVKGDETVTFQDTDTIEVERVGTDGKTLKFKTKNLKYFSVNSSGGTNEDNKGATGDNAIAIGKDAASSANNAVVIGKSATALKNNEQYDLNVGTATSNADSAVVIGNSATSKQARTVAIGNEAQTLHTSAIAIGDKAYSNGARGIAIGRNAQSKGNNSIALGSGDQNDGKKTTADKDYAVAIGSDAVANIANGIALGSESKTTATSASGQSGFDASQEAEGVRKNKYNGLTGKNLTSNLAGLSIGNDGKTRQINHLAAGKADDDAVNVAQLKSVNLAFKGDNDTKGDVRLHDQRLSVVGEADSFITTKASDNKLEIGTKQGTFSTTTDGKSSSPKQGLATTTDVANAINESGWEVQAKGNKVGLVNPGDKVNFTNADKSIEIESDVEASGLSTIKFKAVTETIQTEEKSPITQIDVNGSTVSKTTEGKHKPTGRFVVPTGDKTNKYALATAYDVADKVNQTGWNLYTNGGARSLINPGDYVNFKSGNATNATVVTESSEGATISYDVNVDNTTIKIDPKGNKLTANTGDVDSVTSTKDNSKKGQITIHKDSLEPSKTDSGKLATVDTVVKAVNNATWYAKAGNDKDAEVSEDDTKADETANKSAAMKAGEILGLKAGKNLRVKRDGTNFTFALNNVVDLTNAGSLTIGNTKVDNGGITITPTTPGEGKTAVKLTGEGLNNGGNKIVNVAEGTKDNDAVNYKQLKDSISTETVRKADVTNGDNNIVEVDPTAETGKGTKGATYNISVKESAVKNIAKTAVKVVDGKNTTVTAKDDTSDNSKTYAVNVKGDLTDITSITNTTGNGKVEFTSDGVVNITDGNTTGNHPIKLDGKTGDITGLTNTTLGGENFAKSGRAATEEQLDIVNKKFDNKVFLGGNTGETTKKALSTPNGIKFNVKAADGNKVVTTEATGDDVNIKFSGEEAAKVIDLKYKSNNDETKAKTVKLSNGLDFTNGTHTTAEVGDNGVVKFNVNTAKVDVPTTQPTTFTGKFDAPTTDGVATIKNVVDVVNNSGWKISQGTESRGIVKAGDEVSFANGDGTTVSVETDATNPNKRIVKVNATLKEAAKGTIVAVTENGTGDNAPKKGQVKANTGDDNKVTTVKNVADMINSAKWFAKADNSEEDLAETKNDNGEAVNAGSELTFKAGKNLHVNRTNGVFTFALNNAVNLTNAGSLTIGETKVNNDGITITPTNPGEAKTAVTLTANGLDNGKNKIVNVAAGKDDTDAVNVKQLKEIELHIAPTKANGEASGVTYTYDDKTKSVTLKYKDGNGKVIENTEAKIDLSGLASKIKDYSFKTNATGSNLVGTGTDTTVASGKSVNFAASDNLTLKQDVNNGNVTYTYGLKNQVVVGEKGTPGADGKPGKDGVDGSIGVNGKDGSAVAINGKDGSIGLNGKDGKNGLTIKGQDGKVGVDGKDGETRLVYVEKADPTKPGSSDKPHELATLDDGMKYGGDIGEVANVKLNKQVDVKGGVTDRTKLSDNNIGVVSTPNATTGGTELTVKLAKELTGLTSAEFKGGDDSAVTNITNSGITIKPANSNDDSKTVSLTDTGLNNGGNKITNVAEGENDTDAVNVKQLKDFKAEVADGGLTFAGNSGTAHKAKLNTTVNIKGGKDNTDATQFDDGKNVMTTVNNNTVTVAIKKTPEVEGINITDTIGNVKVKLTQTNEGLKVSDGNNNATHITNIKAGEKDTDAVNVKQLKAAKTEVEAGDDHIDVKLTTGANGQTIYKVSAKGINDTSAEVKAGSNHVEVTKAANTHKDGSTTVTDYTVDLSKETKDDIKKGVDAHTEVTTKGLTFNADKGSTGVKKLGSKVAVNGDGKNITTTADENGVKVSMKDDIKVNSVTAKGVKVGDVNINENGINAGGKRITNVAPGKDGTDAVNVNQLKYVAGNISNQINNVDKGLRAGIAGALASGGLYHVTTAGKSMVSVGAGTYRGQNALAVGYSRLSDNGKVGVKFTVNSNSQGHAGASASVGYQW